MHLVGFMQGERISCESQGICQIVYAALKIKMLTNLASIYIYIYIYTFNCKSNTAHMEKPKAKSLTWRNSFHLLFVFALLDSIFPAETPVEKELHILDTT